MGFDHTVCYPSATPQRRLQALLDVGFTAETLAEAYDCPPSGLSTENAASLDHGRQQLLQDTCTMVGMLLQSGETAPLRGLSEAEAVAWATAAPVDGGETPLARLRIDPLLVFAEATGAALDRELAS